MGPAFMLGSALMFAVMDGLIKMIGPSFRVWDIAFYRFSFGIVILYGIYGGRESLIKGANPGLLILRGVLGSCAFLSIVGAIRLIPISTAMVLFFSFPAFTALFSPLIYRERITLPEIVCIAAAVLGIAFLFDFRFEGVWLGQVLAVTGAVFAGLTVTIIKKLRENHRTGVVYMYFCILGACITFPAFIAQPRLPETWNDGAMMAIIVVASVIGQLLMTKGLRYCKSWEGGVLMTTELIFTSLLGILFLQEQVTWRFWLGGLLILGSVMALQIFGASNKN
jgi:drug/metabolite transporter (DMT)-like permease